MPGVRWKMSHELIPACTLCVLFQDSAAESIENERPSHAKSAVGRALLHIISNSIDKLPAEIAVAEIGKGEG